MKPRDLTKQRVDDIDRAIILQLQEDARKSYRDLAKTLQLSQGTVRNRVKRLIESGILKLQARVDSFKIPNKVAAVITVTGVRRNHEGLMERIKQIPGVTSVWRVTGRYDLFFEIMVDSLEELNDVLFGEGLEGIPAILRTETFVILWSDTKFLKLS